MLKDAGIRDIKKHPVKGNSLKPLVQKYEEALCKLEKTVKVIKMRKKTTKKNRTTTCTVYFNSRLAQVLVSRILSFN